MKNDFIKTLKKVSGHRYIRTQFELWAEIAARTIHNTPYTQGVIPKDKDYERNEAKYMDSIKGLKREELNDLSKMLAYCMMYFGEGNKSDFLGEIYMDLEMGNDRGGEFFTPYHISLMMAQMNLEGCESIIKKKGFISVCEPCCGAGGMIVAVAEVLQKKGFDPSEYAYFHAQDISRLCCNICYIQMSSMGLTGTVAWGNTLTNDVCEKWETPRLKAVRAEKLVHLKPEAPQSESFLKPKDKEPVLSESVKSEDKQLSFVF